jgi:hypothetical protein
MAQKHSRYGPIKASPASLVGERLNAAPQPPCATTFGQDPMNKNSIEDLRWVANEVADLAVLLRSYRLELLATRLESVRQSLVSMRKGHMDMRRGKVILFENFRKD